MANPFASFSPSDITRPPNSDPRALAIADLESMCERIIKAAEDKRKSSRALTEAIASGKTDDIVRAATVDGQLEERVYNLKDQIEQALRRYNQQERLSICISYTVDGLPIRVNKQRKVPLWGI